MMLPGELAANGVKPGITLLSTTPNNRLGAVPTPTEPLSPALRTVRIYEAPHDAGPRSSGTGARGRRSTGSELPVSQFLLQPLWQLYPVAEVPAVSAGAANDRLSVCFRMTAGGAAKLVPELQRGRVLAGLEGCSYHFFFQRYSPGIAVPIRVIWMRVGNKRRPRV
jgi:hypothetical protein